MARNQTFSICSEEEKCHTIVHYLTHHGMWDISKKTNLIREGINQDVSTIILGDAIVVRHPAISKNVEDLHTAFIMQKLLNRREK